MTPRDADDARFEELMSREFPDGLVPTERARPRLESPVEPTPPHAQPEPQSDAETYRLGAAEGFRSWTPPELPDEPFGPPPAPPARRWSSAGIAGTMLVLLPLLLVLVAAFGVRLPTLVAALAGIGFAIGVVLLLNRLRHRPPTDGDGAVV